MQTTVAFQGERGAFSEEAARKLLGDAIEVLPCATFDDVFDAVTRGEATCAVVPIENSLAGSVLRNYELLAARDLAVGGEVFLRISMNLIGLKGARFEEIRKVYSHPVALAQCHRFIAEHNLTSEVAYDTAGSVKQLIRHGARDEGAIAGTAAAEIYGAEILARGIEDHRENFTRFLLIGPAPRLPQMEPAKSIKTTILFRTPNKPGALFRALAAFALRDINLSKLESRPIEGRPWEYSFYADFAGDAKEPNVARAIAHLEEMCESVRVLGSYPAAEF
ncbi:MAG TPA: prephenate dehydratase [Thermoanaerobaculia bacterium]